MNSKIWTLSVIAIIVVLGGLHWYFTSRPDSYFNQYGSDIAVKSEDTSAISKDTVTNTDTKTNTMKNFLHKVTIETSKGNIVFETYDADAPKTVENFIKLAEKGFYNGLIFHRVIPGFMIQGGDPTGTGTGGPGYKFADELDPNTVSYKAGYVRGTVAMANAGPNTNGSQFFIMQKDNPLPHSYSIFGKVISGLDVVDAIAAADRNSMDKPLADIVMKKVTVQ